MKELRRYFALPKSWVGRSSGLCWRERKRAKRRRWMQGGKKKLEGCAYERAVDYFPWLRTQWVAIHFVRTVKDCCQK